MNKQMIIRILKKIMLVIKMNFDIILFFIVFYIKIMNFGNQINPVYFYYKDIFVPVVSSIFIIMSISFIFRDKRYIVLYILDIIFTIFIIGDLIFYYKYDGLITDVSIKYIFTNGFKFKYLLNSQMIYKCIPYMIDLLIIPVILHLFLVHKNIYKSFKYNFFMLLLFLGIGIILDMPQIEKISIDQPQLINTMSNKVYIARNLGCINFHLIDTFNFINNNKDSLKGISDKEKKEVFTFLDNKNNQSSQIKKLNGCGRGKNLIIIQVESLQQFVIDKKVNGQDITPNLNKWINQSMYFDNFYFQTCVGNTSDAEFIINNSIYPSNTSPVYYTYSANKLDSLPSKMKEKGYHTAVFHGHMEDFWNRPLMYKSEGFDKYYGEKSFNMDEEIGMGLSDKSFFNQTLDKLKNLKQPYYSFVITLSSHYPFKDKNNEFGNFDVGKYKGTFLGDYFNAIHYTDKQIGMFLDKLQKEGIMQNSIIVLYGDHNAVGDNNIDQLYSFLGEKNISEFDKFNLEKVPMFIHFPSSEFKGVNHRYCGQMDIYPTLSNIFDLKAKFVFGRDLFNTNEQKVIFKNGAFIKDNILYIPWVNSYYDLKTGKKVNETQNLKKDKNDDAKELNYSDDILEHNLLRNLNAK